MYINTLWLDAYVIMITVKPLRCINTVYGLSDMLDITHRKHMLIIRFATDAIKKSHFLGL